MDRERRRSDTPLPENLEGILNEVQQQALPGIKYLGWEPRFLRHPMFQIPELVMQNCSDGRTGVLNAEGKIRTVNIKIRKPVGTSADPVSTGSETDDKTLDSLREENERLLAEVMEYRLVEARLAEQIEQQRGELCESAEKLSALHAQVESDALAMKSLQEQYAALKAQYSDTVEAHKLELEQLYQPPSLKQA